ncbi:hypothetical protein BDF22DRAFT_682669 [Syncephalis plumigaleata]|nr:hypothetical protein BDF22DRAFT_682669 [Syncephalis plumigaleata]
MLLRKRSHSDKEQEQEKTTQVNTPSQSSLLLNDNNMYNNTWRTTAPLARLTFTRPLIYGTIVKRPNRFIMHALIPGYDDVQLCHCPCTGRIGDLEFTNIPCLLSQSDHELLPLPVTSNKRYKASKGTKSVVTTKRATSFTVEAISLDTIDTPQDQMQWIGINQNRANRFVEQFMRNGDLNTMLNHDNSNEWQPSTIQRECKVGKSKLDFVVDQRTYIEVKTPLIYLPCQDHPNYRKNTKPLANVERLVKHFGELADLQSSHPNSSARLLLCFMYDALPFKRPPATARNKTISDAAQAAITAGVELWQTCLRIDACSISLMKLMRLEDQY